jgi:hypothetical protein
MQKKKSINVDTNADYSNQIKQKENAESYELNEIIKNLLIITTGIENHNID